MNAVRDLIAAIREGVRAFRNIRQRRLRRLESAKNVPF